MIPPKLGGLLDAAAGASDWLDYERPLLEWIEGAIGFDLAFCIRAERMGPHAPGFDPKVRHRIGGLMREYGREYQPMREKALEQGGAGVDLDFFGRTGLQRTRTY